MTDPVVPPAAPAYQPVPVAQKTNTLAIVGFILAFFVTVAGLVVSIIALRQIKETGEGGHGLALAGVIISIVGTVIYVLIILFSILVPLLFLGSACSSGLCNN
jgi:Domain of unknown function (DUF4190)